MKTAKVKEVMIPLAEYATVSEDATLYEAVIALEAACATIGSDRDRHRAILVIGKRGEVVGKVSQWDVLRGLEPQYDSIGNLRETSRYGFSPEFMRSMVSSYGLWRRPLDDLCRKAAEMSVRSFMYKPDDGECVDEGATLDQAIHQLVMGHHQSLLVTRDGEIVGVLRLSDVFNQICGRIKACKA